MQKVEGSSPFIRFSNPLETAGFVFLGTEIFARERPRGNAKGNGTGALAPNAAACLSWGQIGSGGTPGAVSTISL